ncbi:MAG TPA: tetratricopeptide repeat protein [Marmoricola sp.]|nr:tetratricopeptide repeat protein [Marmoricola sp.]
MLVDVAALWDFSDPAGSEHRFADAAGAASGPSRLVLLTQLARARGLQERYAEAHLVLDEVAAADVPDAEVCTRLALERGRVLRSAGDPAGAAPWFDRAADLAREAGLEALLVDALHMVALVAPAEQQLGLTRETLALARASADPAARAWEASLLNNLGMCLVDAGKLEDALATFREALAACERLGKPVADVRVARWMIGWTLRLLGRDAEALVVQEALKTELGRAGEVDPYVDEELARLRQ